MIGTIDATQKQVTVIGGGIAGLLAAYQLTRQGYEVSLFEALPRVGGLIRTHTTPLGISEEAAHTLIVTQKMETLCKDLDVDLVALTERSKKKYILRAGKQRRFPLSLSEASQLLFRCIFYRSNAVTSSPTSTLENWGSHFLGQAGVDYLLDPLTRGIYGTNPSSICVGAAWPKAVIQAGARLIPTLRKNRTRQKKSFSATPCGGMETLIQKLEYYLVSQLGSRFQKNMYVENLPLQNNIVLCVPAYEASRLLRKTKPKLAQALADIRYTPLVTVTAFVSEKDRARIPKAMGVLIPEKENRDCFGILFHDDSVTLIFGTPDEDIPALCRRELREILGIHGTLLHLEVHPKPRAIPVYDSQVLEAWDIAKKDWCREPSHVLFGNYTGQVSIRGMVESLNFKSYSG